jgi:hypothetical protein
VVSFMLQPHYPLGMRPPPAPIAWEAEGASGPVWTLWRREESPLSGIDPRSCSRSPRCHSLYFVSNPSSLSVFCKVLIVLTIVPWHTAEHLCVWYGFCLWVAWQQGTCTLFSVTNIWPWFLQ